MNNGKFPYFIGGGLFCLYSALLLIGNIIMLNAPGFEITAKPFTLFIIQITPEGFAFLYVLLPALAVLFFGLTVIFREKLFYSGLCVWFPRVFFLCAGVNIALAYAVPEAIAPMYESLKTWAGIDIFGLFGPDALLISALFGVGCYIIWKLGFDLILETSPAPYVIVHSAGLAAIVFAWIPALITHGSLAPGRTIVKPLLVVFCLLYYILFQSLRGSFGKSKNKEGYTKISIVKLLIVTVVMGVLLIPYLHAVYLFIDSWATLIVAGVIVVFILFGKGKSDAEFRKDMEALERNRREENERFSRYMRNRDK